MWFLPLEKKSSNVWQLLTQTFYTMNCPISFVSIVNGVSCIFTLTFENSNLVPNLLVKMFPFTTKLFCFFNFFDKNTLVLRKLTFVCSIYYASVPPLQIGIQAEKENIHNTMCIHFVWIAGEIDWKRFIITSLYELLISARHKMKQKKNLILCTLAASDIA